MPSQSKNEGKLKIIGLLANIAYLVVIFIAFITVNAMLPTAPNFDNFVLGALGLLGNVLTFIAFVILGDPDNLGGFKKVLRLICIVLGILIMAAASLITLISITTLPNNTLSPWYAAISGMWWLGSSITLLYFIFGQKFSSYHFGAIIITPLSIVIGYFVCVGLCYTPIPPLFMFLAGAVIFIIGAFVLNKITNPQQHRSYSSSSGRSSGSNSATYYGTPSEDRLPGSMTGLENAVNRALPSYGYLCSWSYGSAYISSIRADISKSSHTVNIYANIRFSCSDAAGQSAYTIKNCAQSELGDIASDIVSRVVDAVEDYISEYSGLDGNWNVSANNITASFSE